MKTTPQQKIFKLMEKLGIKHHRHTWISSANENCPYCNAYADLCEAGDCHAYRCEKKNCIGRKPTKFMRIA